MAVRRVVQNQMNHGRPCHVLDACRKGNTDEDGGVGLAVGPERECYALEMDFCFSSQIWIYEDLERFAMTLPSS